MDITTGRAPMSHERVITPKKTPKKQQCESRARTAGTAPVGTDYLGWDSPWLTVVMAHRFEVAVSGSCDWGPRGPFPRFLLPWG